MDHVRWLAEPSLRRPTLVAAFTGWNDAGDAASNSVRHLIESWQATPLAEIDPEEFTDFATVRPHVRLTPERRRTIVWPTVGVWGASTPGGDVLLLLGPEPALRWRMFTQQVLGIVERCSTSMVITLGALLADVSHNRPVAVMGTSTDQDMIDRFDLQRSRYEGPTGIVGVLHDACTQAGLDTAALWAAVPAYASQVPSPKATLALVERSCAMIGSPAPTAQLVDQAAEYDRNVTDFVEHDDELVGYVSRLEAADEEDSYDDDDTDAEEAPAAPPIAERVDSDELMAEVERYLREQNG
jgi:proteasome assembly chaperone (PAC2) family protein